MIYWNQSREVSVYHLQWIKDSFSLLGHAQQNCLHIPLVNRKKQFENIEGLRTGRKRLVRLIESISTEALSADRSYDANDIPVYVISAGMEPIILP